MAASEKLVHGVRTFTYKHRDGRTLTTAIPQHELGDRYKMAVGHDTREQWVAELRCPNKKCRGWFIVAVRWLKSSSYFTRCCPYCHHTGVLPDELLKYAPHPRPEA